MHRCKEESYKGENYMYMIEIGNPEYYYKY